MVDSAGMELSATVTRRLPAASVLAALLCALTLLASAPSPSASNLKTRVWDFFEDCPLCTDGEGDLSRQSSSGKTASNASDCGWRNLFYNRFRYYDPAGGRFISPDPLGTFGGLNLYAYAPNTTGWLDPYGLVKKKGGGDDADTEIVWCSKPHSNKTPGHWETITGKVAELAATGKYETIYVNKGLSNEIPGVKPNRRPDIMAVRKKDNKIDQWEVPSKSDKLPKLKERMAENKKKMGKRGGSTAILPCQTPPKGK